MKEKIMSILSVFTSLFATLCWTGGLILAPLGLGALGSAYFANMGRFKPLFTVITVALLYWSFTIIYNKDRKSSMVTKIIFWISAILSLIILYLPVTLA